MACKTIDAKYLNVKQCKLKAYRPEVTEVTIEIILLQGAINNLTVCCCVIFLHISC